MQQIAPAQSGFIRTKRKTESGVTLRILKCSAQKRTLLWAKMILKNRTKIFVTTSAFKARNKRQG